MILASSPPPTFYVCIDATYFLFMMIVYCVPPFKYITRFINTMPTGGRYSILQRTMAWYEWNYTPIPYIIPLHSIAFPFPISTRHHYGKEVVIYPQRQFKQTIVEGSSCHSGSALGITNTSPPTMLLPPTTLLTSCASQHYLQDVGLLPTSVLCVCTPFPHPLLPILRGGGVGERGASCLPTSSLFSTL